MSKVKNAELEESALFVAGKLLVEIETRLDHISSKALGGDQIKELKTLIECYNTLKPYF